MKTNSIIKTMKESNNNSKFAFTKNNYILLGVGVTFIIIGLFLMQGGGSEDPSNFNEELFSFQRITLAPIIIVTGFIINVFAILYSHKK
tara:strand:- start:2172 stop:2438 length:267 start_codon:yes stop_codon:yes gene_type:complete